MEQYIYTKYWCRHCKDTKQLLNKNVENGVQECYYCKTKPTPPQPYYHSGTYEAINVIEAWGLNFNLGNVIKYVARAGRKTDNPIEDLEKAKWYIEREIEKLKQK
jgi:glutaredoxin